MFNNVFIKVYLLYKVTNKTHQFPNQSFDYVVSNSDTTAFYNPESFERALRIESQ